MSRKRVRRELLRALVLAALLSTPYMGVGAEDGAVDSYPIKGNTIRGSMIFRDNIPCSTLPLIRM